ncbi:MAG: GrpB family protein [Eubacteriales bacterium]|nr:GrpB family protein [Eubacteriales bacterium]
MKQLSEMTLEELWQLFPIRLTAHQACWAQWYEEEAACLGKGLPAGTALHHVGSTAIDGIWAKPIVDILAVTDGDMQAVRRALEACGYLLMAQTPQRMDFNKGYTPQGFAPRVFHFHLRRPGDTDELFFRDYLNRHPEPAKEYEALKLGLWKAYEHDWDGYSVAKGDFVRRCTRAAKQEQMLRGEHDET